MKQVSSTTPEKTNNIVSTPRAPVKEKKNKSDKNSFASVFDASEEMYYIEMMDEMAECEAVMDEDDKYLISIDERYVEEIEKENVYLRAQLAQFQNAYYTESIKSQSLAQALQIINEKNNKLNEEKPIN